MTPHDPITLGPDGALWFTMAFDSAIGRITPAGVKTRYRLPNTDDDFAEGITAGPDGALWFTDSANHIGRITTKGLVTEFPSAGSSGGLITTGPDGALWFTGNGSSMIGRAPACALGFRASFANGTLTGNFTLGTATPATLSVILHNSTSPTGELFSKAIPAMVPPRAFTLSWPNFPNLGMVTVEPQLSSGPGQGLCAEWVTVDTSQ